MTYEESMKIFKDLYLTCDSTRTFSIRMFPLLRLILCLKLQDYNRYSEIFG
uniref:Uncharacterized protein n=1 Tax=Lepeophtheirus salmonis TaxID=72036 RepID=A0A0K2UKL5_LEPSM